MVFIIYYDQPIKKESLVMSILDLSELNNRLQLLQKLEKVGTDEAIQLTVKRFNDLSNFLQRVIGKELQATH